MHGIGDTTDAKSRLATSGKWHPISSKSRMIVDHDCGCIEQFGCSQCDIYIACKNGCLKSCRQAIGSGDGVTHIAIPINAGDWTKYFVLRYMS